MINEILQFIKKTILAIKLARYNLLDLVSPLKTFKKASIIARFFKHKDSSPLPERIRRFLDAENNPYLYALAEEISARSDIIGSDFFYTRPLDTQVLDGSVLFKTAAAPQDAGFWLALFKELAVVDYPKLKEQYNFFERRLDILNDMRFYASELELLSESSSELERSCLYEVDWIRSDKQKLWLCFDEDCRFTAQLDVKAQESLSRLFAFLLFEKGVFVSFWNGVSVNAKGHVGLLNFDFIYPADEHLQNFGRLYVLGAIMPQTLSELKLVRGIRLMEVFCPDIKVFKFWDKYLKADIPLRRVSTDTTGLLRHLQQSGVIVNAEIPIPHTSYEDVAYLLDNKRHKNEARYRKSSVLYWGPLVVAAYLLLKYF